MSRAKGKHQHNQRQAANRNDPGFAEMINTLHNEAIAEGGATGIYKVLLFDQAEMPKMLAAARAGDPQARMWFQAVNDFVEKLNATEDTPTCICCDQPVRVHGLAAVAMLVPSSENSSVACGASVCSTCRQQTPNQQKMIERIFEGLSRSIFESGRRLNISDQIGHA